MNNFCLHWNLDLVAFAGLMYAALLIASLWLKRRSGVHIGRWGWLAMTLVVLVGCIFAWQSGEQERARLQHTVSGMAPTYADEMARAGLESITEQTDTSDPTYLRLIDMQVRWQRENTGIADIYTFGRRADGAFVLLVDSETDYNHNGVIDEDREQRTAIGEVYEEDHDLIARAFQGSHVFAPEPVSDRWGDWISQYVPVFAPGTHRVIAVLGVDFAAGEYLYDILMHRGTVLSLAILVGTILIAVCVLLTMTRAEMHARDILHRKLVDASRKAGMAEIAVGVLHNVGNALNSVNTSAALISEKVHADVDPAELLQVSRMLREHAGDLHEFFRTDAVGRQLPAYFESLARTLSHDQEILSRELAVLGAGIDHVKEIVRSQQSLASHTTLVQPTLPRDVLEEALAITRLSMQRHEVSLQCRGEAPPELLLDRQKLVQILVNLLTNAVDSLKRAAPGTQRRLEVDLRVTGDQLVWEVSDNGAGIAPEHLPRLFEYGFTTRSDGHGFGLHYSANAAAEMGGTLTASSRGPGQGASFALRVPARIATEAAR